MATIEVILMWQDGRISRTNVATGETANINRVGADGMEREFEPTGTINDEGVELYREVISVAGPWPTPSIGARCAAWRP